MDCGSNKTSNNKDLVGIKFLIRTSPWRGVKDLFLFRAWRVQFGRLWCKPTFGSLLQTLSSFPVLTLGQGLLLSVFSYYYNLCDGAVGYWRMCRFGGCLSSAFFFRLGLWCCWPMWTLVCWGRSAGWWRGGSELRPYTQARLLPFLLFLLFDRCRLSIFFRDILLWSRLARSYGWHFEEETERGAFDARL